MFELKDKNQTRSKRLEMVRKFHEVFGAAIFDEPNKPDPSLQMVRLQLGVEELGELALALGKGEKHKALDGIVDIEFVCLGQSLSLGIHGLVRETNWQPRPKMLWTNEPTVDSNIAVSSLLGAISHLSNTVCMWTKYEQIGSVNACVHALSNLYTEIDSTYNSLGLSPYREQGFYEVFMSNMTKLGEDGKPVVNAAGRIVKGPNYKEPDMLGVIQFIDSQINFEE